MITLILTHFLQTKLRNQTFQLFFLIFQRLICHFKYRSNVIFHTHLAEYGCFLCQISDSGLRTLVHRIFRNIQIIQKDTSLIRRNQSNGHIEWSRFTGTVRSQQTYNLSLLHIYGDVAHYCTFTVLFHQVFGAKHHFTFFHILSVTNCQNHKWRACHSHILRQM